MNLADIAALRLANQQILNTRFTDPAELVAWMGAVQSQDFAMAKWALGMRLKKATDTSVEQAIDAGGHYPDAHYEAYLAFCSQRRRSLDHGPDGTPCLQARGYNVPPAETG